ncbi:DUF1097 domain-containing protein [Polaribacter batillariae]|uniref:DUF1097 domain-containing protein n=1 Tax=Polaribacter batillariae TaxID=2808900 RepID=A0ABX7SZG2_9FLAO|nr:DUF1097 domain-containing protein [Polaribacter batillariae]QTD38901.1 DUF1097 domain-containing protein [Polaribacter batillariae]
MNKKYKNTILHSLLVGLIAAIVIVISGWLSIKAWVVFFAWANYFLHNCNMKKSFKMLIAFFIGIFIALLGNYLIVYLKTLIAQPSFDLYVTAFVVFWIATLLIFLEIIEGWEEFIAATFLGTVLYFASEATITTIFSKLFIPLLIGIFAGYITIISREKLTKILN